MALIAFPWSVAAQTPVTDASRQAGPGFYQWRYDEAVGRYQREYAAFWEQYQKAIKVAADEHQEAVSRAARKRQEHINDASLEYWQQFSALSVPRPADWLQYQRNLNKAQQQYDRRYEDANRAFDMANSEANHDYRRKLDEALQEFKKKSEWAEAERCRGIKEAEATLQAGGISPGTAGTGVTEDKLELVIRLGEEFLFGLFETRSIDRPRTSAAFDLSGQLMDVGGIIGQLGQNAIEAKTNPQTQEIIRLYAEQLGQIPLSQAVREARDAIVQAGLLPPWASVLNPENIRKQLIDTARAGNIPISYPDQ